MRKLLLCIAGFLVITVFASFGVAAIGEAVDLDRIKPPERKEKPVNLERIYGFLEMISEKPMIIKVSSKNYPWHESTLFFNGEGEKIQPGRFFKKYKDFNVELRIDDDGVVQQLRPALM